MDTRVWINISEIGRHRVDLLFINQECPLKIFYPRKRTSKVVGKQKKCPYIFFVLHARGLTIQSFIPPRASRTNYKVWRVRLQGPCIWVAFGFCAGRQQRFYFIDSWWRKRKISTKYQLFFHLNIIRRCCHYRMNSSCYLKENGLGSRLVADWLISKLL